MTMTNTDQCPSWCEGHVDDDLSLGHISAFYSSPLTLEPPDVRFDPHAERWSLKHVCSLDVNAQRGGEVTDPGLARTPRVVLNDHWHSAGDIDIELTTSDARALAANLVKVADLIDADRSQTP